MGSMEKPHAVCIPCFAQGRHINPMLKLAKLLHFRGFRISFVNTDFNHKRLLRAQGPNSLNGLPSFHFETIPDGLPPSDVDATQDIPPSVLLLAKLNDDGPRVTCMVSDALMSFTLDASQELGIPDLLLWTASACGFMAYAQYRSLIDKGFTPLKDESYLTNGYLDTVIDWIPGMKGIRLKDMPSFIRTTDPDDVMLGFAMDELERARKASAIIFNTFDALEQEVLDAVAPMYPPIYTIEPECLNWLDSKEPNSVVYVNYGSLTVMTPQQLIEFAWGLANSNQTFLWILRPDLVSGESAILSPEFVSETEDRQVLTHPAIGGFLTHNGWNSTIERVYTMICWPFFAEQQTNCHYYCTEWGVGMEIDSYLKRDEVAKLVRKLMEGEKGKEMKKKTMEWKLTAEAATTGPNGSSHLNLEKMFEQVLL
ncbi:hypothetical protein PVL29_023422 [Vitis rotundifolia]|uniref:Uncharacterized protein n=1 Tax=Vitis rotundifolia TaxID=103349 RepID=A0AA38YNS2_VITRO|nr:hypothetical protein PVL29_023422 [Vitis rotundifolia]